MMEGETVAHDMPEHVRRLLGAYEGLRGYHMLPEADRRLRPTRSSGACPRSPG